MKVEIRQHPAQAMHPKTEEPLWFDDERTQPVPLFAHQRGVFLLGYTRESAVLVGYCGDTPGSPVCIIAPLPEAVFDFVVAEVAKQVGEPNKSSKVPDVPAPVLTSDDFEEDEEDG